MIRTYSCRCVIQCRHALGGARANERGKAGGSSERTVIARTDATKTPPDSRSSMNTPASPFFRDVRMPSSIDERHVHERFLLDTLAERKAGEKPSRRDWLRGVVSRSAALLRLS